MNIALLGLTVLMFVTYGHVSNNIEKYGNAGNLVARTIVLISGTFLGASSAFLFLESVADPTWAFGSGFVFGPLLAVSACFYMVAGIFFPLAQVRGLLRYTFRIRFNDDI